MPMAKPTGILPEERFNLTQTLNSAENPSPTFAEVVVCISLTGSCLTFGESDGPRAPLPAEMQSWEQAGEKEPPQDRQSVLCVVELSPFPQGRGNQEVQGHPR